MTENDTMTEIDISNELSADLISRREAILRMSALLGGVALIGSGALIAGCRAEKTGTAASTPFTADDIAYLDHAVGGLNPQIGRLANGEACGVFHNGEKKRVG